MNRYLSLFLALTLIGCGGGNDDDTNDTPEEPATPSLTLGTATTVQYAAVAEPATAESGAVALTLTIAEAGRYQCDASAGQDAQMAIFQGTNEIARDSDSGEGVNSRIVQELAPGTYEVRVWEWLRRADSIVVNCMVAPPAPTTTALALGTPATVHVAAGEGDDSRSNLTLTIASGGEFQCDAHAQSGDGALDAQMAILQGETELEANDDGGDGFDSRIVRSLAAGSYTVRVWEYQHRDADITVSCAPAVGPTVADGSPIPLGSPVSVVIPEGEGEAGQVNLVMTVEAAGSIRCYAHSGDRDAQMAILSGDTELATDSDSGEGTDSMIVRDYEPGTYTVRLWEWLHRPTTITVNCGPAT